MKSMPHTKTEPVPVEEEQYATSQEAVPLPYLAGTRKIAVRWMTGATNRITRKAKQAAAKK